jgi:hypothetical protein
MFCDTKGIHISLQPKSFRPLSGPRPTSPLLPTPARCGKPLLAVADDDDDAALGTVSVRRRHVL